MIVKRFYDEKLAQASYLIGCAATGEALVVDPNRDVAHYIDAARRENLRIAHVTETHIHADFVSGLRELARRTGAVMYLSDEGDASWKYAFAGEAPSVLLHDGDHFRVGNVRVDVLHTPGHTPEHLTFLVTDGAAADRPIAALTGDFVFVGDVGRPDLLERVAGMTGTMEAGARRLFRSLQAFKAQPDWLQIWPGHGAGSACGKGLSAIPHSTVGYERLFNWAFAIDDEDEFVRAVLAGQPEPPRYFAEMKRINRDGPRILDGIRRPERLPAERLAAALEAGALVVDARPAADFAAGHLPGTINIPLDRSFTTWAGWLLPYDRDLYLIVDDRDAHAVDEATADLAMIGLDRVAGWFGADALAHHAACGAALGTVPQLTPAEVAPLLHAGDVTIVDVRNRAEWEAARLPTPGSVPASGGANAAAPAPDGAPASTPDTVLHIPLGYLADRLAEIPAGRPVVVHCQSGSRSAIAASVLRAHGFQDVANLAGGLSAWQAAGLPVVRGAPADGPTAA